MSTTQAVSPKLPKNIITDEQVAAYHRDGFVILRGMFNDQELFDWKDIVLDMLRKGNNPQEEAGVRVWMAGTMDERLQACMCDPRLVAVLVKLIGKDVEFLSAKIVFKSKKTTFGTPWHQDWYYWYGSEKVSVWLPLDEATPDNGTLRVIPGTHRMSQLTNMEVSEGFNNRTPPEQVEGMPVVDVLVKRGDAVFFSDKLVHGSYPNRNGADRFAFIPTYRPSSIKDSSAIWPGSVVLSGKSVNEHAVPYSG